MKPEPLKLMENATVKRIVEAAILAAGQPLSLVQLNALFGETEPVATEAVAQALAELREDYAERGVELVEVASGFRFQVRGDVHPFVARLWTERQTKYSRALLETLALIAYRQPITRAEIEQIRGVAVSSNIIRTLEEREWVRVVGHRDVPGKPALFGTTRQFLDYFNLKSLDQLPPLSEIRDIEELEPQLDLAATVEPAAETDGSTRDDGDAEPSAEVAVAEEPHGEDHEDAGTDDAELRSAAPVDAANESLAAGATPVAESDATPTEGDAPADDAPGDEPDARDAAVLDDPEDRT